MDLEEILNKHKKWLDGDIGERANLSDANLSDANLSKANLSNADLRYANLSNADLRYADLSKANLSNADLSDADLSNADLSNADLRYANLSDADLRYADLSNADLRYADLSDANLSKANLRWARLEEIHNLNIIIIQMNTSVKNRQIKYIPSLNKVFVGCFSGTLEELQEQVEKTHKNNPKIKNRYLKTIKFIEEMEKDYES